MTVEEINAESQKRCPITDIKFVKSFQKPDDDYEYVKFDDEIDIGFSRNQMGKRPLTSFRVV